MIEEAFEEALRRDTNQQRPWVILIDGHPHQLNTINRLMKEKEKRLINVHAISKNTNPVYVMMWLLLLDIPLPAGLLKELVVI